MSKSIMGSIRDKTRMLQWLLLSLLAYVLAAQLAALVEYGDSGLWPRMQTVLWKVGHLNLAAYLGYWFDRRAFRDRIDCVSKAHHHIRRAIIMAATMIAFGLAL